MLHAPSGRKRQRLITAIKNNFQGIVVASERKAKSRKMIGKGANVLFGANSTPLSQKDGGIRFIASRAVLRRLVGKIIRRRVQESLGEHLRPAQLGYGTKDGCEIAVHATRAFLEKGNDDLKCLRNWISKTHSTQSGATGYWTMSKKSSPSTCHISAGPIGNRQHYSVRKTPYCLTTASSKVVHLCRCSCV